MAELLDDRVGNEDALIECTQNIRTANLNEIVER
jgi:hypothetical protein